MHEAADMGGLPSQTPANAIIKNVLEFFSTARQLEDAA